MKILAFAFLVGHGLVHGVMWALPYSEQALADLPMDPGHSWLFGDARAVGLGLALATTVVFIVTAFAVLAGASWWPPLAVASAGVSMVLLTLFFSTWWAFGYAVDVAVIAVASRSLGG